MVVELIWTVKGHLALLCVAGKVPKAVDVHHVIGELVLRVKGLDAVKAADNVDL